MCCQGAEPVEGGGAEGEEEKDRGACKTLVLDIFRRFGSRVGFRGVCEALVVF